MQEQDITTETYDMEKIWKKSQYLGNWKERYIEIKDGVIKSYKAKTTT